MPGKVKVKIIAGRNLPVMDRSSDTTDAYVEIKLGNITHKTDVCRKSLNPQWNSDWYRFEMDDAELQDEPLQVRLMDYDTYSANDAIGKVHISLNPLLLSTTIIDPAGQTSHSGKGSVMSGWIPVFDTMHGIRGEVNLIVKVDLFSDVNKFRQSSCGVQFFHSPNIPHGYHTPAIHGFVEELVVNDDPEYQWIDKIRTPRASNEARQVVFQKLSGQVQRKIGLKAIEMGANAVIGYKICLDLEGDVGVVARGIGTAVTLIKIPDAISTTVVDNTLLEERTLKYLEFLACSGTTSKNVFDSDSDAKKSNEFMYKMLGIETTVEKSGKIPKMIMSQKLTKLNDTEEDDDDDVVVSNENIRQLLEQEDSRGEQSGNRFTRKLRKIHKSSKNLLNRKIDRFKTKTTESTSNNNGKNLENQLMSGSMCDVVAGKNEEAHDPHGRSLTDLRRFNRRPKRQKPQFRRSASDGAGMATLLVASLMSSQTIGLDCIAESHDSPKSSPKSDIKKHIQFESSISNSSLNTFLDVGKRGDLQSSNLSVNSSTSSCTESSSSDDEASDSVSESTRTDIMVDAETVSMVVKTVLAQEGLERDDWTDPNTNEQLKMNNLLIRTGSTRVKKDGESSQYNETMLIEHDTDKELFDAVLSNPGRSESGDDNSWIEPGSTVDEPEIVERPTESLLHGLKENIAGKIHYLQEHMPHLHNKEKRKDSGEFSRQDSIKRRFNFSFSKNLFHRRQSRDESNETSREQHPKSDLKHESGLIGTAMKTLLIDKVNLMEEILMNVPEQTQQQDNLNKSGIDDRDIGSQVNKIDRQLSDENETVLGIPFMSLIELTDDTKRNLEMQHPLLSPSTPSDRHNSLPINALINNHSRPIVTIVDDTPVTTAPSTINPTSIIISNCPKTNNHKNVNITYPSSSDRYNQSCLDVSELNTNNRPMLAPLPLPIIRNEIPPASPTTKLMGHMRAESTGGSKMPQSPAKVGSTSGIIVAANKDKDGIYRRSSDSDLSVTPKGNSLTSGERTTPAMIRVTGTTLKPVTNENLDMLEYPFLTMDKYPAGFILHLGSCVCARSVKLLERVPNPDEPETRDSWWTELRMEIRSHARALGCNVILGYSELTTISEDVCVLSATGTAAVINLQYSGEMSINDSTAKLTSSMDRVEFEKDIKDSMKELKISNTPKIIEGVVSKTVEEVEAIAGVVKENVTTTHNVSSQSGCSLSHIPYTVSSVPFNVSMDTCALCKRCKVPDVLLATIEIPESLQITGRGCLVQAQVCRAKRDLKSESNAKEISDGLPFLEYELHRLLINKLKVKGMNAIFGLRSAIAVGEKMMTLIATGTAVFLSALPQPVSPKIVGPKICPNPDKLVEIQKTLQDTIEKNREIYQLKIYSENDFNSKPINSESEESDDEVADMDLTCGNKDTCILEVDDIDDLEVISLLMEPCPPDGFHVVNTQSVPGLQDLEVVRNLQYFSQVWRGKFNVGQQSHFARNLQRLLQSIYFKLRSMIPCAICDLRFIIDLPEAEWIQVLVTGMALGLGEPSKMLKNNNKRRLLNHSTSKEAVTRKTDDDLIFNLEEDHVFELPTTSAGVSHSLTHTPTSHNPPSHFAQTGSLKLRNKSPTRTKMGLMRQSRHMPLRERYGVDITPLSYVPGGKIEKYLGNLNFFFIRESTSIRENGGVCGFVHSFITELLAVVRAHVTALGGNAIISFYMTELILNDSIHKNQGQCLISVGGDVVFVSYFTDD